MVSKRGNKICEHVELRKVATQHKVLNVLDQNLKERSPPSTLEIYTPCLKNCALCTFPKTNFIHISFADER